MKPAVKEPLRQLTERLFAGRNLLCGEEFRQWILCQWNLLGKELMMPALSSSAIINMCASAWS